MKKYSECISCRVEPYVIEYIKNKGIRKSDFIRLLIYEKIQKTQKHSSHDVNSHINEKENKDEITDINERVDRTLMQHNR